MPTQYTLDPNVPNMVRVTDPDAGLLNKPLYDPQKYQELQAQQQQPAPALTQPWNGQMYGGNDETPGPFDDTSGSPPAALPPQPPPGMPPPAAPGPNAMTPAPTLRAPSGSMAIPAPPPAPPGTQLHKAEVTPGTAGRPYDLEQEEGRHEGLIDRKLQMQSQSDAVQAVLNEQDIRMQQQAADDEQRRQEEERKKLRYEKELEQVKRETGPMSAMGAIGSAVLGLVGLFVARRSQNPGLALSRMNHSLDAAITKDIEIQRHERDSKLSRLTAQLGDAQQAELMYRANVRRAALDRVKGHLQRLGETAQTQELMRAAETEVQTLDDNARAASYNKPGTAKYEFQQPKPVKGGTAALTGSVAGAPEEEEYVDHELLKWGQAKGLKPNQVQHEWAAWNKPMIEMAPAREAIRGAQSIVERYRGKGDVPGKGTFANMAPDWWVGTEGNNVRANIQAAKAFFQKEVSGTAVSDKERKLLDGLTEGRGNYTDIANGLSILKRIRDAQEEALGGSNPAFLRIHRQGQERRNKAKGRNADFSAQDSMPPSAASAKKQSSNESRTRLARQLAEERGLTPEEEQREADNLNYEPKTAEETFGKRKEGRGPKL